VREDGTIADVTFGGPAEKAGVPPSTKLIAVNGRQFTPAVLRDAVAATASGSKPIDLMVRNGEFYQTHRLEYRGGERYPHLVRDNTSPDLLSQILQPKAR
jgi:predicted metalloprotease with PDZ domain